MMIQVFKRDSKKLPIKLMQVTVRSISTNIQTVFQVRHLSEASGHIPAVVLKNCEPELSYILAELFNKCVKESCFPDCWKVSLVVPVFKNVG